MTVFASEFPANADIDSSRFAAAILAWVRGIQKSDVLTEIDGKEIYDDDVWLESPSGEELAVKSYEDDKHTVFGVRHELPDKEGRRWRTEAVYTCFEGQGYLRVRGQCVATDPNAQILMPQKPHFITQSIEDGWGSIDGTFKVQSTPHYFTEDEIDTALGIFSGSASRFLPVVYVSRGNDNQLPLDVRFLAKKLSGVAHVVVEPNRAFSFKLKTTAQGENPYAGATALFAPGGKQLVRLFKRSDDNGGRKLAQFLVQHASRYMSGLAAKCGWEWQHIQEAQSRNLREKVIEAASDELEEYMEAFDAEIRAKDEQIKNLKELLELAKADQAAGETDLAELVSRPLCSKIGDQIYDGEFSDRLRLFLSTKLSTTPKEVDARTEEFCRRYLKHTLFTGRSGALVAQIKTASRDGKRMPKELGALLEGIGYQKSQDGKHLKFTPPDGLFGVVQETLPSTPSDSQRGGKNRGLEVIRHLNLMELKGR